MNALLQRNVMKCTWLGDSSTINLHQHTLHHSMRYNTCIPLGNGKQTLGDYGIVEYSCVTEDDGVEFATDDESAPCTLEDIDGLLGVGLRDL